MRIYDISKESRPRERFLTFGPESLSDAELLALVLRTGSVGENVLDLSNRIISKHGLKNLFSLSIEELIEIRGIGKSKATLILAISELGRRRNSVSIEKYKIRSAKSVFELFSEKLKDKNKEYFYTVLLDTKNNVIKTDEVSVGILDASIVHSREIFREAIRASASRIILVHNHPSGDPTPSVEDLDITKKMIDVGELLGIEVLDHVIIGKNKYWSYCEG